MTVDARFTKITKDPRFSRIKKKDAKIPVDDRFSSMFKDRSFSITSKFDKYGRKTKDSKDTSLLSLYQPETQQDFSEDEQFEQSDLESELSTGCSADEFSEGEEITLEHPQARNDVSYGDRTNRLAVTNIDWDYIKAVDLFKLLDSFKPKGGSVQSVKIFPSEFGKQRMAIEDLHGPVLDSFSCSSQSKQKEGEEQNESSNEEQNCPDDDSNEELNQLALKKYKLEKLRYYYAVIECDSTTTASIIYDCCDGAEFEKSSNFLDLRFVPDSVTFDDGDVHDIATEVNDKTFKPRDFSSSSIQNTTQKLAWDEDDIDRSKLTKGRFTAEELETAEFDSLLASGTDSEGDDASARAASLDKYRSLLSNESLLSEQNPFGKERAESEEMEVTFTPGLADVATDLLDKKQQRELHDAETPFESRVRKDKERRKARRKQLREQFVNRSDEDAPLKDAADLEQFVSKPEAKVSFTVNPDDERFSAVYDSSLYAIDPTHPSFKKSEGLQKILDKKRMKREN